MSIFEDEYNQPESTAEFKEEDFKKLKINDYIIIGGRPCKVKQN
jgi:hypothetical protein